MIRTLAPKFAAVLLVLAGSYACKKPATVAAPAMDSSLIASLDRGPCQGRCPVYRVELYGSGRVKFDGKQHVASTGVRDGTATSSGVQSFMRAVAASQFATVDTSFVMGSAACGSYVTDLPMMTLSIKVGSRMKSVQYDIGCRNAPKFLRTLEAQLDTTAGTAAWIAGKGEKK